MKNRSPSWLRAIPFAALALSGFVLTASARPEEPAQTKPVAVASVDSGAPTATASVDELKVAAYKALRDGKFDQSGQYLKEAAAKSSDPTLTSMVDAIGRFNDERKDYQQQRTKTYTTAVDNVHKLLDAGKNTYAIDWLKEAYVASDDKDKFSKESWVDDLAKQAVDSAAKSEAANDWLTAFRLYVDLGVIEPANPQWKDKLKTATRRIRILADYAPDVLKKQQEATLKQREEVDALITPTTQPAHKPTTEPTDEDAFKTDWHDTLRGIKMDMLRDGLVDAHRYYFKDISYKELTVNGLRGLETLATTPGIETAFPKLADATRKQMFLGWIDQNITSAQQADPDEEERVMRNTLDTLDRANADTLELPEGVLVSEFADGAFSSSLDQFSYMIWPADLEDFNRTTQGEFSGIGVQIEINEADELRVVSPVEDSPAYKLGIQAGDVITRINGKNAKGISINEAVKNITGPSGTTVTVTLRSPEGVTKDYTITRDTIHVASLKGWQRDVSGAWDYFIDPAQKIAYLRLSHFTASTEKELDAAATEIKQQGAKAIILDLRYNPGGLLTAACAVADKFMSGGVILSTKPDREVPGQDIPPIEAHQGPADLDMPMVILVNQYSASGSEIVAGALQDHHRAIILGERSYGKGCVQMVFGLGDRSSCVKVTTCHYFLPSGRCLQREDTSTTWGVDPDLHVEMTIREMNDANAARQQMDVLHDPNAPAEHPAAEPTTKPALKPLLDVDAQLAAALLVLRMQLAGPAA